MILMVSSNTVNLALMEDAYILQFCENGAFHIPPLIHIPPISPTIEYVPYMHIHSYICI